MNKISKYMFCLNFIEFEAGKYFNFLINFNQLQKYIIFLDITP